MSEMQNLIEHMAEIARREAEAEFAARKYAMDIELLEATRRADAAEAAATAAIEAKDDAVAALEGLRAALAELLSA